MQSVAADAYRGKRVRFAAVVRTRDLDRWAGLWMRVDRPFGRSTFDNMQTRPLRGNIDWTRAAVVLDVAADATSIHFGLLQDGNGSSWIDEASFEVRATNAERGGAFGVTTYAADSEQFSPGLTRAKCELDRGSEWKRCDVVLDVPPVADVVAIALGLEGRGAAWIDDVTIERVGRDVPLTHLDTRPRGLVNVDLEEPGPSPKGWFLAGGARAHYEGTVDTKEKHGGRQSARLEPRVAEPKGYGTLMQHVRIDDRRGKRLRMNAFVKGRGIDGRGDMWLRVQAADSPGDGPGLGGGTCKLSGTFDWKPCTIVFDVPDRSDALEIGIGLAAHGTLWIDDVTLDEVDANVPLTNERWVRARLDDGGFEGEEAGNGWFLSGGAGTDFRATRDTQEHAEGRASMRLETKSGAPSTGYGTFMTAVDAKAHHGKRMRLTAQARGRGVTGRGDVWLRVQAASSPGDGPGLGGGSCKLSGDFDWKPCAIVFDVPDRGTRIEFGAGIAGPGTLWLDDVKLEEVEKSTTLTRPGTHAAAERSAPHNLDFER
jgi:hypothetical protein